MQLTMATVAEHVAVQEDIAMAAVAEHVAVEEVIASMAAEPAGDERATAGDGAGDAAGDGAGDDKPAEPCTKRRKTHMPPEVKEWFCSLARVKPRLDQSAVPPLRKEGTPILLRARAHRHPPASGSRTRLPVSLLATRAPWNPQLSWPWQTSCSASAAECAATRRAYHLARHTISLACLSVCLI